MPNIFYLFVKNTPLYKYTHQKSGKMPVEQFKVWLGTYTQIHYQVNVTKCVRKKFVLHNNFSSVFNSIITILCI